MAKPKVLVACKDRSTRERLTDTMRFRYRAVAVEDGWLALHLVNTNSFFAMVIAEKLESLSGLDVAFSVRESHANPAAPILLVAERITPHIREMLKSGIIDRTVDAGAETGVFLFEFNAMCSKRAERAWDDLDADVSRVLRTARHAHAGIFAATSIDEPLDPRLLSATADCVVEAVRNGRIAAVMKTLQSHEDYTFVHSLSVAAVLAFYGREIGIRERDLGLMAQAGFAHDIGKRATPLSILYKPGLLDSGQMVVMRHHPRAAGAILRRSDGIPQEVINVAERHHERMDGSGYPNNLRGIEIDDLSMVAAIGDVFSALVDHRCYKPRYAPEEALKMLRDMSGAHLEAHHAANFSEVMVDTGFVDWVRPPPVEDAATGIAV